MMHFLLAIKPSSQNAYEKIMYKTMYFCHRNVKNNIMSEANI